MKSKLKKQLKPIENDLDNANKKAFKKLRFLNGLSFKAKEALDEIRELDKKNFYTKLVCVHTNGKLFEFNIFRRLADFIRRIYFDDISLKQALDKQDEVEYLLRNLEGYKQRNLDKMKYRTNVLKISEICFQGGNLIVYVFEEDIFPLPKKEMFQPEK